ncbi:MAG TPA: hypothetical protein VM118_08650 [Acidobacteriota bacterium]|nr:hypothetical protein [Acidobacteriota bacterium]
MRTCILRLLGLLLILSATGAQAQVVFEHPETAVYHPGSDRYFISCVNSGNIVQIDANWDTTNFYTLLPVAVGMTVLRDSLYVLVGGASGMTAFDLITDKRIMNVGGLPPNLNDICADSADNLYITDYGGGRLYRINIHTKTPEIIAASLPQPTGIHYDYRHDRVLFFQWTTDAVIQALDPHTLAVTTVAPTGLDGPDGIVDDPEGNYYISFWGAFPYDRGTIYMFDSLFTLPPVLVIAGHNGPANFCFNAADSLFVVPNALDNTVDFLVNPHLDPDGDGVASGVDNCPYTFNPNQVDLNNSGIGDVCEAGFTPSGSTVAVDLNDSISVVFDAVTEPGVTQVTINPTGPEPPEGYRIVPPPGACYYDIATDATYAGTVHARFLYDPADLGSLESDLRVFHATEVKSGTVVWEDCTASQDLDAHAIEGAVTDLFVFILAELDCQCPCHADPQCDGVTDVLDVVKAVNVAFRDAAPGVDPGCPNDQTDVSCDGATNVIDVVKFVNVAFRSGDPMIQFCDPCAP